MRGEVLGRVERRRRWSAGEKLAVVMASMEPEAVVATVARRGDLGTPGGVVGFLEVVAETPTHAAAIEAKAAPIARAPESATAVGTAAAPMMTVEIVLVGGRVLRAPAALPTAELRRLIGAVEGA